MMGMPIRTMMVTSQIRGTALGVGEEAWYLWWLLAPWHLIASWPI